MNGLCKGEYGYLFKYKRKRLVGALISAFLVAFGVVTTILVYGDTGHVLIIFAILMVLPFAKFLVAYLLVAGFSSLSQSDYDKICQETQNIQGRVFYDMTISQYEGIRFFPVIYINNGHICIYITDTKRKKSEYEDWLFKVVKPTKYEYSISITTDVNEFIKDLKKGDEPSHEQQLIDKYVADNMFDMGV